MSSTTTTKLKVLAVTVSDVENHIFVFASLKIYIKRGPKNPKNCKTYTAFLHKLKSPDIEKCVLGACAINEEQIELTDFEMVQ